MCRSRPGFHSLPQGCDFDAFCTTLGSPFLLYVAHTGPGQPGNTDRHIYPIWMIICVYFFISHFLSHKQSKYIMYSFSIAFLSSLFVVCLFKPVPTSIVLQPRDLSMSFCLIHTESVCVLLNQFIYSHFSFCPSFLLRPSFRFLP